MIVIAESQINHLMCYPLIDLILFDSHAVLL